ncbi:hypothetical protein [Flavobacterium pectinovorum]|uniref:Lipoprotein n=1 Tax=Flavobacterium pectinovorum TaxID=29533 RepID=A0A502EIJ1_9FLAO|nr:hypothetical protein [Flavobacterium pectinovorum]TPG36316.1 hypothetical protein EAH81_19785 [Flavobacterium pectinovorum]
MKSTSKIFYAIFILLSITACNNKKPEPIVENKNFDSIVPQKAKSEESIEGLYKTQPDPNNADECEMSIEISKVKNDYFYFLKTKLRKLKGKATFTTNESGEKYLVLESIKWDDYEGDISNEDETDSISDQKPEHKELEIPVGIDASYVKDTLTIQNYGNSMNSYTKISECGRKYIQLIKK